MKRIDLRLIPPALALLVSACSVRVADQEAFVRIDPQADAAQVLVIHEGIGASDEKKETLDQALDVVRRARGGHRWISLPFWGSWNLDDPEMLDSLDPQDRTVLDGIRVEDAGLYLDEGGRLAGYQRIRVTHLSRVVALWSRKVTGFLKAKMAEPDFPTEAEEAELDARSIALLRERAESGRPWFWLSGGELTIDLPVTRATWNRWRARFLAHLHEQSAEDRDLIWQHLAYLTHLEVGDERVVLRFSAPGDLFRITHRDGGDPVRPELRDRLLAEDLVDKSLTRDDVRHRAGFEPR